MEENSRASNGCFPENNDDFLDTIFEYANGETEERLERRPVCDRCRRPITVCWCPFLPTEPLDVKTEVYILQHPFEESRCLRTAPMLYHSVRPGKCHIVKSKKFRPGRFPEIATVLQSPNTILLYPGDDAVDISELPSLEGDAFYTLVLLDGTWQQAKGIYTQNAMVKWPQKVKISHTMTSKYVIRTQPNDTSLSTLETAAIAISILENRPTLVDIMTRPLDALCQFQMAHGAVAHQSKQHRIENGLWEKKLPQKLLRKMEKQQSKADFSDDADKR
ncbi:hypothetical protein ScPMuIL_017617 [Solemya velum]